VAWKSNESARAVKAGFAKIVGTEKNSILIAITEILKGKMKLPVKSPFGDVDAGEK
jgi:UDP-N-acetylglucosamine 2-epimerase